MGQKVNPHGLRVGIIKSWDSNWYANKKDFAGNLLEDHQIREFIQNNYKNCGISKVVVERTAKQVVVNLYTARPGMVIGQKGAEVENMKARLAKLTGKDVSVNVIEIKNPDLDAQLVAEGIAAQLDQRVGFRRAIRVLKSCLVAVLMVLKLQEVSFIKMDLFLFKHSALILTMVLLRLMFQENSALKFGFIRVKFLENKT